MGTQSFIHFHTVWKFFFIQSQNSFLISMKVFFLSYKFHTVWNFSFSSPNKFLKTIQFLYIFRLYFMTPYSHNQRLRWHQPCSMHSWGSRSMPHSHSSMRQVIASYCDATCLPTQLVTIQCCTTGSPDSTVYYKQQNAVGVGHVCVETSRLLLFGSLANCLTSVTALRLRLPVLTFGPQRWS